MLTFVSQLSEMDHINYIYLWYPSLRNLLSYTCGLAQYPGIRVHVLTDNIF